jgi:glutamyl/glutaminyl-tRNA synthetase
MSLGRFAPSPTGVLHLGNLRTALASWLSARSRGGQWLVRMEDVDGPRCRRDLGEGQLQDLAALGLESDLPVLWQSARSQQYRAALAALHGAGRLYPCICTRKDLQLLASAPHAEDGLRPYPGRCRDKAWEGFDRALRFRLPEGPVVWQDLLLGAQEDAPATLTGDPLLFRRDGCFAYHLAVVVDDGAQGVTEVVRGADLRTVTATQIRLKRAGALGLAALAGRGIGAEEVLGWLGWSLGCLDRPAPCAASGLVAAFDWSRVPRDDIRVPEAWF